MKLWAGRFHKETDTLVNDFNSSITFDARLYRQDIAGSIAHARMLGKQGIIDIVENRLVGMKDRGVYETPGGTILYFAHQQLEMLTVDKDTLHVKQKLAVDYADLIYNGK